MRELTQSEVEEVSSGVLIQIGMGIAGAVGGMAVYSIGNWSTGLREGGFVSAAAWGMVAGALGFSPAAALVGAGVTDLVGAGLAAGKDEDDS